MANLALKQEEEAQKQEISALIHSFTNPYATYRKEYMSFDTITRAYRANNRKITEKTQYIGDKARKLLAPIIQKLLKGETVLLNSKYISKVTKRKTRQNKNILNELRGILNIKYHKSTKYYLFEFIPAIVYELSDVRKKVSCNKLPFSSNDSIYIKNKDIEDIDLESNFLQNSESDKLEENTETQIREFSPTTPTKLKKRASNQRKKPTMAQAKARIYKPFAYSKPKTLADMIPSIDNTTCDELRSKSGRPFSDNFIIQLVLKMSQNPKITASFDYKNGFIAYMIRALQYEKHDAVKTGNINFRFKDNIPVSNNISCQQEQQKMTKSLQSLPEGIWGDICRKLIETCGIHVYNNWFSKLTPVIDEDAKTIELKAQNSFIQRWIEDNYRNVIEKTAISMGLRFKEIIF